MEASAAGNYPPPLFVRGVGSSGLSSRTAVDTSSKTFAADNLLLSSALAYSTTGTPDAGLYANDDTYNQYNLIQYPNIHFGYGKPGDLIVGKHNWWRLFLHPEIKHMQATGLVKEVTGGYYLDREYVLSLYELPAQLPINAATAIKIGQIGGVDWANVTISGRIAGDEVTTEGGSVSAKGLATRKGATLSDGTTLGEGTETVTGNSVDRETFEATAQGFYPIAKSSDTARCMFIAINPGNDFFDRFASLGNFYESPVAGQGNRLSAEHWYQYSMGCNRCAMKLDVISVSSSSDQTPTGLRFTYVSGGSEVSQEFLKSDGTWPDPVTAEDEEETFPFHALASVPGRPALEIRVDLLESWMNTLASTPDSLEVNHSIVINADYTQTDVAKPSIPSVDGDTCVLLNGASDLTNFPRGFSIVTNYRVYVMDDVNQTTTTPPVDSGLSGDFTPPFSMFCPEVRFGLDASNTFVHIEGQVGTTADSTDGAINVVEQTTKMGTTDQISGSKVSAELIQIEHPASLPPINHMNWLIVVQRVMNSQYSNY